MTKGLTRVPMTDTSLSLSIKDRLTVKEELLLPDYCPDIGKVILLNMRSAVTSSSLSDSGAAVSGLTFLNLIYESTDGEIKKTEYSVPFRKNYPLKDSFEDSVILIKAQNPSVSCKLLSKRRLEARGSFSLEGEVFTLTQRDIVEKSQNPDIVLKEEKVKYLVPYDSLNEVISYSEELIMPDQKETPEEILDITAVPRCEKCSYSDGVISLKGEIGLEVLYVPKGQKDKIEKFSVTLPLQKEWEEKKYEESFIIKPLTDILSLSLTNSQDVIKEDGKLLFEGEISCRLLILAPSERCLAADGFSTLYECEKEEESLKLISSAPSFSKEAGVEGYAPAPSEMRELAEVSASGCGISIVYEEEKTAFCDVKFDVLFKNAEDKYCSMSHTAKCSVPINEAGKDDFVCCDSFLSHVNAELANGKLKFSSDLTLCGFIAKTEERSFLSDIKPDEEKEVPKIKGYSMVIYYADESDDLWKIGCRYKVSPEKIMKENSLKDTAFKERTPLIIPL